MVLRLEEKSFAVEFYFRNARKENGK
ncbi:hypothetical protein BDFB_006380 [Asbolus verrucosus]|uniref:Uncharacterized protein n=1 Tax=Asbolus verrucosus TaxID=1661398 RepID=A0A482VB90_ASBVE|nr:hypothetical protein BDFB_006380 [Asbolus verrucosus]